MEKLVTVRPKLASWWRVWENGKRRKYAKWSEVIYNSSPVRDMIKNELDLRMKELLSTGITHDIL